MNITVIASLHLGTSKNLSRLFEIARVLVRFDHADRFIVNSNHGIVSDCDASRIRLHC